MRKYFVLSVTAIVFTFALSGFAQGVAEGKWINLFDGESLFGWIPFGDVDWSVVDGVLTATKGGGGCLATTCAFKDFELAGKIRVSGNGNAGLALRIPLEGHYTENGGCAIILQAGKEYDVSVKAIGNDIKATLNGEPVEGLSVKNLKGHIGILYHRYHEKNKDRRAKVEVSELKLKPLNLKSIFNGKDLSGWEIIPGHKSVFTVEDGNLTIRNGVGQIETTALYKDFLLQIDIKCNGDEKNRLNSGVFFRGPKGVFWKGYESQIKNQWIGDDRTKPVDFGTGGIYGVQEARKVVPNEREWFTKTIICDRNHMAVWVNGYLVSDLYDFRPVHPEGDGKNGYVPSAGTIHLQGHDEKTDLSFKDIWVQEYPSE
ncbi:MAG: DUF1080 domain-containing protein [Candidatus Hydrogenedentes bacterium]|nr:DUF1080 domain-containing protein [Candidatus Hydrogenedentota bacterium]